jgi:hypothetical protein
VRHRVLHARLLRDGGEEGPSGGVVVEVEEQDPQVVAHVPLDDVGLQLLEHRPLVRGGLGPHELLGQVGHRFLHALVR